MLSITLRMDPDPSNIHEITMTSNTYHDVYTIDQPLYVFMQLLHAAGYSREVIAARFIDLAKQPNYDAMIDIIR